MCGARRISCPSHVTNKSPPFEFTTCEPKRSTGHIKKTHPPSYKSTREKGAVGLAPMCSRSRHQSEQTLIRRQCTTRPSCAIPQGEAVQSRKEKPIELCDSAKTRTSRTAQSAKTFRAEQFRKEPSIAHVAQHTRLTAAQEPFVLGVLWHILTILHKLSKPVPENVGLIRLDVLGRANLSLRADGTTRFVRDCNVSCQVAADRRTDFPITPLPICDNTARWSNRRDVWRSNLVCAVGRHLTMVKQGDHTHPKLGQTGRRQQTHPHTRSSEYNGHSFGQPPVHTALTFTANMSHIEKTTR